MNPDRRQTNPSTTVDKGGGEPELVTYAACLAPRSPCMNRTISISAVLFIICALTVVGCDGAGPKPEPSSTASIAGSTTETAPEIDDLVALGEKRFTQLGCNSCHSQGSTSGPGHYPLEKWGKTIRLTDGSTVTVDEAYIRESIESPLAKIVEGYNPVMPDYSGQLKDGDVDAMLAYLKWLDSPAE
jgi:cytochrome c5